MKFRNYVQAIFLLSTLFFFCHLISNDEFVEKDAVLQLPENEPDWKNLLPIEDNLIFRVTVILGPNQKVEIFPEIFEEIESIPHKLGESFRKGNLLLKMKNESYASQLDKALKGEEYAAEDVSIKISLFNTHLISKLELLQAKLNLAVAKAAVAEAARNFEATIVIAPFDGKVAAVYVREYERPSRQKSMMEIIDDKKMIAKFIIPSNLLPQFSIGQVISIYIKDLNKHVSAKVTRIGAEINPVSWTVNMEAEIDNTDGSLIPGMQSYFELSVISGLKNQ